MARTRTAPQTDTSTDQTPQEPTVTDTDQTSTDQTSTDQTEEPTVTSTDQTDQTPQTDPVADVLSKIESAATQADTDTGTVPETALEPVRAAYKALSPARRTKIQSELAARMTSALRDGKVTEALTLGSVSQALASLPSASEKTPADPYAGPVALFTALAYLSEVGPELFAFPEGVDATEVTRRASERVAAILSADEGAYVDAGNLHALRDGATPGDGCPQEVILAAKIMSGRAVKASTRSGAPRTPRTVGDGQRDLGKIIAEVMSATPGVPMKVSAILAAAEAAGHGRLSSGAVSNRIKAGTVAGVQQTDVDGALGATYSA